MGSIPIQKYFHILVIAKALPESILKAFEDTEELRQTNSVFKAIVNSKSIKTFEGHKDIDLIKLAIVGILYCKTTDIERATFIYFYLLERDKCVEMMNEYLSTGKHQPSFLEFTGQSGIIIKKIEQQIVSFVEMSSVFMMKVSGEIEDHDMMLNYT